MPTKLTKTAVEALSPRDRPYEVFDDRLTGFVVRVNRGGQRTFWLRYPFAGRRSCRHKLGAYPNVTVEEARALAKAASGDVARGINPADRKKEERLKAAREHGSPLASYLDKFYEPWARAALKNPDLELRRIRSDFAGLLAKPMESIDAKLVERLQQEWKQAGLKPGTINRDINRISGVLTRAVADGRLDRHPLHGATKQLKTNKRKVPKFLGPDEKAALRKALLDREARMRSERASHNAWRAERGHPALPCHGEFTDYMRPMVMLSLLTGLRRGEAFNLVWEDVNLKAKSITVQGDETDDGGTGSKSGQSRPVPLHAGAIEILSSWHEQCGKPTEGLVFASPSGGRLTDIKKAWDGIRKAAGLPKLQFRWLRDTFASNLVQKGVPLKTVKDLLGHADIKTTEIYAHLAPDNLSAAVAMLETL